MIPIERLNALLIVTTQPKLPGDGEDLDRAPRPDRRHRRAARGSSSTRCATARPRTSRTLIGDLFSSRRTHHDHAHAGAGSAARGNPQHAFGQQSAQTTATTATPPAGASTFQMPGGSGTTANEVRVIADKDTNSLLILATPADYDVIEAALKKLDVVRRQVLVEVMLAEVTLSDDLEFGIDWFISAPQQHLGHAATMGALPSSRTGTVARLRRPAAHPAAPEATSAPCCAPWAPTARRRSLAAPQVMVLDNEKAEIKIGDRISVQTQSQTGVSTGTGGPEQLPVPRNRRAACGHAAHQFRRHGDPRDQPGGEPGRSIRPEPGNPNPDVGTRSAKTSVVVASGESIVLGGPDPRGQHAHLQRAARCFRRSRCWARSSGTQTLDMTRTELVMVVTPKIVSDTAQARQVTEELRRKLPSLEGLLPKLPATPPPDGASRDLPPRSLQRLRRPPKRRADRPGASLRSRINIIETQGLAA